MESQQQYTNNNANAVTVNAAEASNFNKQVNKGIRTFNSFHSHTVKVQQAQQPVTQASVSKPKSSGGSGGHNSGGLTTGYITGSSPNVNQQRHYNVHYSGSSSLSKQHAHDNSRQGVIRDHLPQRVITLENYRIAKVICGSDQTYCITQCREPKIFSWGSNHCGKLGHSYNKNVSSGGVKSTTSPHSSTQGSSIQVAKKPKEIKALQGQQITDLACGNNHAFAWSTHSGLVYAWGNTNNGRLGNEVSQPTTNNKNNTSAELSNTSIQEEPQLVECFEQASQAGIKIQHLSAGENHSVSLATMGKDNIVFVWGCNDKNQLGMVNDSNWSDSSSTQTVNHDVTVPHQLEQNCFETEKGSQESLPSSPTIVQVCAGYNYSAAINAEGKLFMWGSGEFGRLGDSDIRRFHVPTPVKDLSTQIITRISLGYYHGAAINDQGMLFTWGRGISGQLGTGSILNEDSVKHVSELANIPIKEVECGESHTVALTIHGEVYSWGGGQLGQLGHGDFLRQSIPLKVANLEMINIVQISSGKRHTACVSDKGDIYSWGSNEYGQLGRPANMTLQLCTQGSNNSNSNNTDTSGKSSPATSNLIQSHQLYNKLPPHSTEYQAMQRFEFPINKSNSNGGNSDFEEMDANNLLYLNRMAVDSVNLSSSLSPHQNFTPLNRLHEISPYNKKHHVKNLQLDNYSDRSGNNYHGGGTASYQVMQHQQLIHAQQHQAYPSQQQHMNSQQMQGQNNYQQQQHYDETPKYIKNLRAELNTALRKNMELRMKVEQIEEEQEHKIQNQLIETGEQFSQQLRKVNQNTKVDQVISTAYEQIDQFKNQTVLKRYIKSNLEALGSLRKEVILQQALINQMQTTSSNKN